MLTVEHCVHLKTTKPGGQPKEIQLKYQSKE